jgi:hypothetical protein
MTIYLYALGEEQRITVKKIQRFTIEYFHSWFPKLGSYSAFSNRLSETFKKLVTSFITDYCPEDCFLDQSLLDSLPIITCSGKRSGKVAKDITDKAYCSTKSMFYYGVKLHALAFRRENRIPFPYEIQITPAYVNDLSVFKQVWSTKEDRFFFGNKSYQNKGFFSDFEKEKNAVMMTPVKAVKGECQEIRNRDKASNDLYSIAVSRIGQPIESFFNWLIEKTNIQRACKARSTKRLLVHVFGKRGAAFINLIF